MLTRLPSSHHQTPEPQVLVLTLPQPGCGTWARDKHLHSGRVGRDRVPCLLQDMTEQSSRYGEAMYMFILESRSNSTPCPTPEIFLFFSLFSSPVIQVTCHPL